MSWRLLPQRHNLHRRPPLPVIGLSIRRLCHFQFLSLLRRDRRMTIVLNQTLGDILIIILIVLVLGILPPQRHSRTVH
jgi:hypothetical protein